MISRTIEWCERNRFLVFTGAILLSLAGAWSLRRVPLDALPDISDVQVIIHTEWAGEPPNVIEDPGHVPNRFFFARRTSCQRSTGADDVWGLLRLRGVRGRHGFVLGAL